MDAHGLGGRWSLKWTSRKTFTVDQPLIDENVHACEGVGGTGDIPLWGFELNGDPAYDMVMLRAEDFKKLASGEITLVKESKSDAKRRVSSTPELLRGEE